jgi:hypothetical protein
VHAKKQAVTLSCEDVDLLIRRLADDRGGQELVKDCNFKRNGVIVQQVFEIGRLYNIMNPDRMRSMFGELLHMLMHTFRPRSLSCLSCPVSVARRCRLNQHQNWLS